MSDVIRQDAVSLLNFLGAVSDAKTKTIKDIENQEWSLEIKELQKHIDWVSIYDFEDENRYRSNSDKVLLIEFVQPVENFNPAPMPSRLLEPWLEPGWEDETVMPLLRSGILTDSGETLLLEDAENSEQIKNEHTALRRERQEWLKEVYAFKEANKLFTDLHVQYNNLKRDSESIELIISNAFFNNNAGIDHPLLTRNISLNFDVENRTFYFNDLGNETELYNVILQELDDIDYSSLEKIEEYIFENSYHPLDNDILEAFSKRISHRTVYASSLEDAPKNWGRSGKYLVYDNPTLIIRKRIDGTSAFLSRIREGLDDEEFPTEIPYHVGDILSGDSQQAVEENEQDESIEKQLAAVGGEDSDILLAKEANREQLRIAQRIENNNAVVVQGPPGTGKTHTIANLTGHFLAQGKTVLITSHTQKALSVLKDKLPKQIRNLSVALLDDSNDETEKSVNAIIEYTSLHSASQLLDKAKSLQEGRSKIIEGLSHTRKRIYEILQKEHKTIVLNGEEFSAMDAAEFVKEHENTLNFIPGKVEPYTSLPLTRKEFSELYRTNEWVNVREENELMLDLPETEEIVSDDDIAKVFDDYKSSKNIAESIAADNAWTIFDTNKGVDTTIQLENRPITINHLEISELNKIIDYINKFSQVEQWMINAVFDGTKTDFERERWSILIDSILKSEEARSNFIELSFGKKVTTTDINYLLDNKHIYIEIRNDLNKKGKLPFYAKVFKREYNSALEKITIDGKPISNAKDLDIAISYVYLLNARSICNIHWSELISNGTDNDFLSLDEDNPESVAKNRIPLIEDCLDFPANINKMLSQLGIRSKDIYHHDINSNNYQNTETFLNALSTRLKPLLEISKHSQDALDAKEKLENLNNILTQGLRVQSTICQKLYEAIEELHIENYEYYYQLLVTINAKKESLQDRNLYLERIQAVAPEWAYAIRKRSGIHGEGAAPRDLADAWKWKQLEQIIDELRSEALDKLQIDSKELSKKYREVTSEYASTLAWYHLKRKIAADTSLSQNLNGWMQTIKKIGKGTGKRAPKLRAQARQLMLKCQEAVPVWIMPTNKLVNTLDPNGNKFDILIVDEASQSDISSLGLLFMAKKVIIVGDDEQVSPSSIGFTTEHLQSLYNTYLENTNIPNKHLYDGQTSLYDIASTTYQPLMLREHFRCVPDIINYSNKLSYDYKIKPLRDSSDSKLFPAFVNYRVEGTRSGNKVNEEEARTIVKLIESCIALPEYAGKTFGIISMLGSQQHKRITELLHEHIPVEEIERRQIICGNPPAFQGDERDVIFLSLVDSNLGNEGPLRLRNEGRDNTYKKRYNVAASRAKDQLWVVHSLDSANDLKEGDIRKTLLDYSSDPNAFKQQVDKVKAKSDSIFEEEVALSLINKGYEVEQQKQVGAYSIDMVIRDGNNTVAIECDGERFHSGDRKIREDMERQTILERAGWTFIRIRGSEYFRDKDKTIERVINDLTRYDINPSGSYEIDESANEKSSDLRQRIDIEFDKLSEKYEPEQLTVHDIKY